MDSEQSLDWDTVFAGELAQVERRRASQEPAAQNLVGLALSGGGIRSATFGLGVLEALKWRGLLSRVDYLSTVSGGGYIGAWLSANCQRAAARAAALQDVAARKPALQGTAPAPPEPSAAYKLAAVDWLAPAASWRDSIAHLRRYSNYLSPQIGFVSADTWTMLMVWIRNTLLVQLTIVLALATLLVVPRLLSELFAYWPHSGNLRWISVVLFTLAVAGTAHNQLRLSAGGSAWSGPKRWIYGLAAAVVCFGVAAYIGWNRDFQPFLDGPVDWKAAGPIALLLVAGGFLVLPAGAQLLRVVWQGNSPPTQVDYTQGWVQAGVVMPMMIAGYLVAAVLWGQINAVYASIPPADVHGFGPLFMHAWRYWPLPLCIAFASLWLLSLCSIGSRRDWRGVAAALLAPLPAVLVLYALLCVIILWLQACALPTQRSELGLGAGQWSAYVWGPPVVLYAFSLAVVMLIGMMGRDSAEAVREWWSRLAAWLAIYGFAWLVIAVAAVYGPLGAAVILDADTWQGAAVAGGWFTTTLAALLAGKSDATPASNHTKSAQTNVTKVLGLVVMVGPFVFIAGLLIGVSTALHMILLSISAHDWQGMHDLHIHHWRYMNYSNVAAVWAVLSGASVGLLLMAWRVDINEFGLNAFYRSRLSRCYLGATRFLAGERNPQNFTGFDEQDDLHMAALAGVGDAAPAGPLHIVNCALNLGGSSDLSLHTRHSASFTMTPYAAGSSYRSRDPDGVKAPRALGYRPLGSYGGTNSQPTLGQVTSISGAAASPNMGYHTSPVVAFLMTVFNVRLGWWLPNPKYAITSPSPWFGLRYLVKELFGGADESSNYLMISDGGHFENLAAYELVRRRCRVIIVSDAECDPELNFEGLGALIRMCEVDFETRITIDVNTIRRADGARWSEARCAVGKIEYGDGIADGVLIYLKAAMSGNEDTAVLQYQASHALFPHEPTSDQFYGEDQFESYRRLGRDVAETMFRNIDASQDLVTIGRALLKNAAAAVPRAGDAPFAHQSPRNSPGRRSKNARTPSR